MARSDGTAVGRLVEVTAAGRSGVAVHANEDALRERFEQAVWPLYHPLVRRLVLVLGNQADAEDVAQETLLRAWSAWSRFDGRDVRAWLYTIGLRLAFNHMRHRRRWLRWSRRPDEATWIDAVDPDLLSALRLLEPHPRAALLLSAIDGYTQREIAAMLEVPEGTVASWISRARRQTRTRLGMPPDGPTGP